MFTGVLPGKLLSSSQATCTLGHRVLKISIRCTGFRRKQLRKEVKKTE